MATLANAYTFTPGGLASGSSAFATDAAIGTGMAFLNGELEKRDPRLLEPLHSVTWPRDIVSRTGGGWVEFTSNYFSDYQTTGGNDGGIIASETTDIPLIQASVSKDVFKVFTFANNMKIPYVDQQKLQQIGRSLDDILDKGVRLNYAKTLDYNVYLGFSSIGTYGLVNNPNVTAATVATGATSGKVPWSQKTPQEILTDVNNIMVQTWTSSEYDTTGMANHILVPPTQYSYLVSTIVSSAGNISILEFLLQNNIGKNQGVDLQIHPSRWCAGAGASGADRMVAYVNDEDRVNFDITVPLNRVMTQPSVEQMGYLTGFLSQVGQVKLLYTQPIRYGDGI